MADNSPVLPRNLLFNNILLRLPVISIGRFRCVSKQWRFFLSTPEFIRNHLNAHIHDPPDILIFSGCNSVYTANLADETESCGNGGVSNPAMVLLIEPNESATVLLEGTCHGLVLLSQTIGFQRGMVLINPVTLEAENVPNYRSGSFAISGIGYDSLNDDYKIVSLSRQSIDISVPSGYFVDVYSVKAKTWKRIADSQYNFFSQNGGHHGYPETFVNGCIHWLAYEPDNVVAAFSLVREEFEEVEPPGAVSEVAFGAAQVCVLGGFLALVVNDAEFAEVWMMKEYGVQDSWMKFTITIPHRLIVKVIDDVCCLGDDDILVRYSQEKLLTYNWRNGIWRNLVVAGTSYRDFYSVRTLRGSLVSPNHNRI